MSPSHLLCKWWWRSRLHSGIGVFLQSWDESWTLSIVASWHMTLEGHRMTHRMHCYRRLTLVNILLTLQRTFHAPLVSVLHLWPLTITGPPDWCQVSSGISSGLVWLALLQIQEILLRCRMVRYTDRSLPVGVHHKCTLFQVLAWVWRGSADGQASWVVFLLPVYCVSHGTAHWLRTWAP